MTHPPHPILAAVLAAILATPPPAMALDDAALREQVLALGKLTEAPQVHPAEGFVAENGIEAIYYDALPWKNRPTRVFAWMGIPETTNEKVPGIVLVHGGGGTAFKEWVAKWNEKGYAAISIAVEGQTDVRPPDNPRKGWMRHDLGGPARDGIYADSAEPLADQWIYHAVADTILANSLLRSLPKVDPDRVGLMGVSWGGIVTSTVIGIDTRFAFAIPTYGCGDLADVPNHYGRALGDNALYRKVWDPMVRLANAKMPTLWFSWTGDQHFPLDALRNCYAAVAGPYMVALLPRMGHGHPPAWNPPDSYAFADSVTQDGRPWCRQTGLVVEGDSVRVRFSSTRPIDRAVLTATADTGFTGARAWSQTGATVRSAGKDGVVVEAILPGGTTAWFVNLHSGDLVASSDYQESK